MNCKPGDIAIVIGRSIYAGRLVECLSIAPMDSAFSLPNGALHLPAEIPEMWILKSLGSPFEHALYDGMYGVGSDRCLRPINRLDDCVDFIVSEIKCTTTA